MVNSQREKSRVCILQKYIHCLKWVAHLFLLLSLLEGKSHFTVIALQIFHLWNGFRAIAVVLLKSLNSCPWSAKEHWRGLLWFFPAAGSQPCRKGHKLENDDQVKQEAGSPGSLEHPPQVVFGTVNGSFHDLLFAYRVPHSLLFRGWNYWGGNKIFFLRTTIFHLDSRAGCVR